MLNTENIYDIPNNTEKIFEVSSLLNTYIEQKQPWHLAKDETKAQELKTVLFTLAEGVRMLGLAIRPIMPNISEKILTSLDYGMSETNLDKMFSIDMSENRQIKEPEILFPKLETPEIQ